MDTSTEKLPIDLKERRKNIEKELGRADHFFGLFFEVQKRMWSRGIIDTHPDMAQRYGLSQWHGTESVNPSDPFHLYSGEKALKELDRISQRHSDTPPPADCEYIKFRDAPHNAFQNIPVLEGYQLQFVYNCDTGEDVLRHIPIYFWQSYLEKVKREIPLNSRDVRLAGFERKWQLAVENGETFRYQNAPVTAARVMEGILNYTEKWWNDFFIGRIISEFRKKDFRFRLYESKDIQQGTPQQAFTSTLVNLMQVNHRQHFFLMVNNFHRHLFRDSGWLEKLKERIRDGIPKKKIMDQIIAACTPSHLDQYPMKAWEMTVFKNFVEGAMDIPYSWDSFLRGNSWVERLDLRRWAPWFQKIAKHLPMFSHLTPDVARGKILERMYLMAEHVMGRKRQVAEWIISDFSDDISRKELAVEGRKIITGLLDRKETQKTESFPGKEDFFGLIEEAGLIFPLISVIIHLVLHESAAEPIADWKTQDKKLRVKLSPKKYEAVRQLAQLYLKHQKQGPQDPELLTETKKILKRNHLNGKSGKKNGGDDGSSGSPVPNSPRPPRQGPEVVQGATQIVGNLAGTPLQLGLGKALQNQPAKANIVIVKESQFTGNVGKRIAEILSTLPKGKLTLILAETDRLSQTIGESITAKDLTEDVKCRTWTETGAFHGNECQMSLLEKYLIGQTEELGAFQRLIMNHGGVAVAAVRSGLHLDFAGLGSDSIFRQKNTVYIWLDGLLNFLEQESAEKLIHRLKGSTAAQKSA